MAFNVTRYSVPMTVSSGAWNSGTTPLSVNYPTSTNEGDVVYLIVQNRPNTITPSTPSNWTQVLSVAGGGGSQGAGTGQTRITVFRRVVGSGGLTGSQSVTVTSSNSTRGCMVKCRASGTNLTYAEAFSSWSNSSGSTNIGGTTAAAVNLRARDQVFIIMSLPDDSGSAVSVASIASTGSSFSTPSAQVAYGESTTGDDLSGAVWRSRVRGGSGNAAVATTATYDASETSQGVILRVRATADLTTPRTTEMAPAFHFLF